MKKVISILILLTVVIPARANDKVVATVGSKKITLQEFNRRYEEVSRQTLNPPDRKLFLEDLVRYELGLQEAQEQGLEKDPAVREKLNQQLYKALIEKALAKKVEAIKVNESEMKKYYSQYPEIRTSHILIELGNSTNAKDVAKIRKRAEEIQDTVKKSKKPFSDLVKLYSDDQLSKKKEGDIGWQNQLTLVPEYYNSARRLKLNQISSLVKTRFGFHIIKLTGIQKYEDSNKRSVRAAVFDRKRKALFDEYFAKIKKKYKIKINKEAL